MPSDERRILLITGAGASTELGKDGDPPLPLMAEWAERLRTKIGPDLSEMTGLIAAHDGVAFEETLGALMRWHQGLDAMSRFRLMTKRLDDGPDATVVNFSQAIDLGRANGDRFLELLHESLFDEFGPGRIEPDKALTAFSTLFALLALEDSSLPSRLVLATTNYDRSIEIALAHMSINARTGFVLQTYRTPVLVPKGLGAFAETPSVLYLHGAVGWYRQADGAIHSVAADQRYKPSLGIPAVLYPSPNKDLEITETAELWSEFQDAVKEATHILVVGHALNDDHLVHELASTDARIAVTYRSSERATAGSAAAADAAERRIRDKLPAAVAIAVRFGPELAIDPGAMRRWHGGTLPTWA